MSIEEWETCSALQKTHLISQIFQRRWMVDSGLHDIYLLFPAAVFCVCDSQSQKVEIYQTQ